MTEINVAKQPKPEKQELSRGFGFDSPLFRGNLFSMSPFALMRQFTDEMDQMFAQTTPTPSNGGAWRPAVEVKQKDGKLLITAELPGLKKEDLKVHIDGDTLVVEGERKEEKEEKREGYYHSERSYGKFYRSILLPENAQIEQTAAQFDSGVLEVTIPVPEAKAKRKDVPVQEGSQKAA